MESASIASSQCDCSGPSGRATARTDKPMTMDTHEAPSTIAPAYCGALRARRPAAVVAGAARIISSSETGSRSATACNTVCPVRNDLPKSPCSTLRR